MLWKELVAVSQAFLWLHDLDPDTLLEQMYVSGPKGMFSRAGKEGTVPIPCHRTPLLRVKPPKAVADVPWCPLFCESHLLKLLAMRTLCFCWIMLDPLICLSLNLVAGSSCCSWCCVGGPNASPKCCASEVVVNRATKSLTQAQKSRDTVRI